MLALLSNIGNKILKQWSWCWILQSVMVQVIYSLWRFSSKTSQQFTLKVLLWVVATKDGHSKDGTHTGNRLPVLNFTFTVLEEGSRAYSCEGNHVVAIIKEPQNYDLLMRGLAETRETKLPGWKQLTLMAFPT